MKAVLVILSVLALSAVAFEPRFLAQQSPLIPAKNVNLEALSGNWYELRRVGFGFEANTACSKVRLAENTKDGWDVTVTARAGSATGQTVQTVGTITAQGPVKNEVAAIGKFNAQFAQGAVTEFYVFAQHTDQKWVLFGSPDRKQFWLLSRYSSVDDNLVELLENMSEESGFDISTFVHVDQNRQCFN